MGIYDEVTICDIGKIIKIQSDINEWMDAIFIIHGDEEELKKAKRILSKAHDDWNDWMEEEIHEDWGTYLKEKLYDNNINFECYFANYPIDD